MPHIAIARFSHEGNSFSPVATDLAAFGSNEWALGAEEAAAAYRGTATEIGGALAFLDLRPDWSAAFLRLAGASPAGPVPRADFEQITTEIVDGLRNGGPWDGVYLSLHGAMVAECLAATETAGVDADVLDLRTLDLHGLDWDAIGKSIKRTNRVLIAEQAARGGSHGARWAAEIQDRYLDWLDAEVVRVSGSEAAPVVSRPLNLAALGDGAKVASALSCLCGGRA